MTDGEQFDELELIQEKNKDNMFYLFKNLPKSFKNPEEAKRAQSYVKRQALQLIHRSIEVVRSESKRTSSEYI